MAQEDGDWDIYLLSLDGGEAIKLTNNGFEDGLPAIAHDGKMIAYISNESIV
jgi:Tol biopolymer transport system component